MAKAEEYANWIVRNADKKGTPEFETVKQAYISAKAQESTPEMDFDPTSGMSTFDKLAAGAGKGVSDMWIGGKQALGLASQQEVDEKRKTDAALMKTGAGQVGNVAGQVLATVPAAFVPGANTYAGATALGALTGLVMPTAENESRLQNVGMGAAGGVVGKFAGDKAAKFLGGSPYAQAERAAASSNPRASASASASGQLNVSGSGGGAGFGYVGDDVVEGLNSAKTNVLARGKELGFKATPGQASGSRALQQMEAKLESQPMTSAAFNKIKADNQTVLNRIAANSIGETADTLDSGVLQSAQQRIGAVYKQVADDNIRAIDPDSFLNKIAGVENEFEGMVALADDALVKKFINYAADGKATGKQLQDLASKIGRKAANEMTTANGDRQLGMALFQVKEHVDEVLAQGLSGKTAEAFNQARQQYRNLMLLTSRSNVVNPASGDVSGGALANMLQQKDKAGYLFGKTNSDLYDAARFAQAFKPIVGDSGTATRSMVNTPMDFVVSLPFNLATKAYTSSPVTAAAGGAANVINNGLLNPETAKLLSQFGGLLGVNAATAGN